MNEEILNGYSLIVDSYAHESDRAAAILAAAFLDESLAKLLKAFLVDDPAITNELFKVYAPLSSFSARINMAYALGLISKHTRHNLNYIRKIRNHFAHHPLDTNFDNSPVSELCQHLSFSGAPSVRDQDPKSCFLFTTSAIAYAIALSMDQMVRQKASNIIPYLGEPIEESNIKR